MHLYDVPGGGSWCSFHTGLGHCRVHGRRRELLLHAWVWNLGSVRPLDQRRHHVGLRVSAQGSHDGGSDGSRRGVVLWNLLINHRSGVKICVSQSTVTRPGSHSPSSLVPCSELEGRSSRSEDLQEKRWSQVWFLVEVALFGIYKQSYFIVLQLLYYVVIQEVYRSLRRRSPTLINQLCCVHYTAYKYWTED